MAKLVPYKQFISERREQFQAKVRRKLGPGSDGRASRVPRPLVEGRLIGKPTPATYALWVYCIGRGINEEESRQQHFAGYGVVFPIAP